MQDQKALAHLKAGITAISCLKEPLDNEVVADLYFLMGFLQHAAGDESAATTAFQQSHYFDENLGWDSYFSPEGQPLFDQAKQEVFASEKATLTVSPAPPDGTLWINGQPALSARVELPLGDSFLQLTGEYAETFMIEINTAGERDLLLANQLPLDALSWVSDDDRNDQLEALFISAFELDQPLYAVTGGAVWSHVVGTSGWRLLAEAGGASKSAIEDSTRFAKQPQRAGMITAGIGGASAGFALGSLAAGLHAINTYQNANNDLVALSGDSDNAEEAIALSDSANTAKAKVPGRMIVAGIFTVTGGAGVVLSASMFAKAKKRRKALPSWHPYALTDTKGATGAPETETAAGGEPAEHHRPQIKGAEDAAPTDAEQPETATEPTGGD
jgi:hypothetical protein